MPARIELITPKPTRPPQRRRNPVDDVELHALAWRLQQRRDVLLHNIGQLSRPLLELGGPECRADIATLKQITRAARDLDDAVIERMTSMDGRDVHKYGSSVARQLDEHERKLNRLIRKWEANRAFTVTRKKPGRGTAR